jgi:hypothetical protein
MARKAAAGRGHSMKKTRAKQPHMLPEFPSVHINPDPRMDGVPTLFRSRSDGGGQSRATSDDVRIRAAS